MLEEARSAPGKGKENRKGVVATGIIVVIGYPNRVVVVVVVVKVVIFENFGFWKINEF